MMAAQQGWCGARNCSARVQNSPSVGENRLGNPTALQSEEQAQWIRAGILRALGKPGASKEFN